MQTIRTVLLLVSTAGLIFCVGCGGAPPIPVYGAGAGTFEFQTSQLQSLGSTNLVAWGNTTVYGNVTDFEADSCSDLLDDDCIIDISEYGYSEDNMPPGTINPITTNANGRANFDTDAYNDDWAFYAQYGNADSGCQSNMGDVSYGYASDGGILNNGVTIFCDNSGSTTNFVATPSGCSLNWVLVPPKFTSYEPKSTCPATVSVSVTPALQSSVKLPTGEALTEADFSTSGTNLAQSTVTPSSTTTLIVPTPTTPGTTYIIVYNSTANDVLGYVPFTYTVNPEPPPPVCGAVVKAQVDSLKADVVCSDSDKGGPKLH